MTDPKYFPYDKQTLFKINYVIYRIMIRTDFWNGIRDDYRYELRELNNLDAKPFIVNHEYLYNTEKQTADLNTKPSNRWK